MLLKKKQRYKPLYKKLLHLRKNIVNNKKILKFKKKKWTQFLFYLKLEYSRYKQKPYTLYNLHVTKFASLGNSFKKRYKENLHADRKFRIFYGDLTKKQFKKQIKSITDKLKNKKNRNYKIIENFESRLDIILFRSLFSYSIRNSRQMITHGYITVNNKIIKKPSYILKKGDIITVLPKYNHIVKRNLKLTLQTIPWFWFSPIPPSYLIIKYSTMQIIFGNITDFNFSACYPFWVNTNFQN